MLKANFWQNKTHSKNIVKEKKLFEDLINSFNEISQKMTDLSELFELAIQENNAQIQNEIFSEIKNLRILARKNEIKCFLSNEADTLDCYIEICF